MLSCIERPPEANRIGESSLRLYLALPMQTFHWKPEWVCLSWPCVRSSADCPLPQNRLSKPRHRFSQEGLRLLQKMDSKGRGDRTPSNARQAPAIAPLKIPCASSSHTGTYLVVKT